MIRLLDTTVIVDALRGHATIRGRLAELSPDDIVVPSVAIAKLAFRAERSKDPARAHLIWREFVEPFVVVPFDHPSAEEHGRLRFQLRANPIGERDLLIAATAVAYQLTVVTSNTREFSRVPGLRVEDWKQ